MLSGKGLSKKSSSLSLRFNGWLIIFFSVSEGGIIGIFGSEKSSIDNLVEFDSSGFLESSFFVEICFSFSNCGRFSSND